MICCKKCIYWSAEPAEHHITEDAGRCHRYPPPVKQTSKSITTSYIWPPLTGAGDWCGEGKEKVEKPRAGVF